MKLFLKWFHLMPYVPPVPGRRGRTVWDELIDELPYPWDWEFPFDWAAA